METGDPKQLAVLVVLAVGALGFMFTRLGGKAVPLVAVANATERSTGKAPLAGTLILGHDPFSHPQLAPKAEKVESDVSTTAPEAGAKPKLILGPLPSAGALSENPVAVGPLDPGVRPEKAAKPDAPTPTMIGLEAVAGASDAVAFLTVGNAESQPFHPKDRVTSGIRLLRVEDGAVVLQGPRGPITLDVGERKSL